MENLLTSPDLEFEWGGENPGGPTSGDEDMATEEQPGGAQN